MNPNAPFNDPAYVSRYVEDAQRKVPGLADLYRMAALLLAERMPDAAQVLVVGAGGGLELKTFAEAQPHWTFAGVDPSAEMLALADQVLGPLASRVQMVQGRVEDAPPGPFDGAACLLTLHFLGRAERLEVLKGMHRRLKPGAPFVVMHHCRPRGDTALQWLARCSAFAQAGRFDFPQAAASAAAMVERLPLLLEAEEEALLEEAGFSSVALFYAAFSLRGWVAVA